MLQLMKPGFGTIQPEDARVHEEWVAMLMRQEHLIESWQCDLSTGIFQIGETTRIRHGLDDHHCGLLDIVRRYETEHSRTVLNILEEATATASSFCFCTMLQRDGMAATPVFCVGTSSIGPAKSRMQGIFAFTSATS